MNYALIVGQGRSGTNWLLEMLDHSERTFARNEPEGIVGSPLAALMGDGVSAPTEADFGERWDSAIAWASSRMGVRDHTITAPKFYLYALSRWLGGARIASGTRLRSLAAQIFPSLRRDEWPLPRWFGSSDRLSHALAILKINNPGWVRWALQQRPEVPVLHIVRHPGGFLNSWTSRYLKVNEASRVKSQNAARLERIAAQDEAWAARFGDTDRMSVEESELWYWLYSAETTYLAGRDCQQYHHFVYEDITRDVLVQARRVYAACGLEWTSYVEEHIRRGAANSQAIADGWRGRLPPDQLQLVERILDQARTPHWWSR